MALVTPIAQPRPAFDSRNEARFIFTIDDSGDRIVASYIEIIDQSNNSRVYWNKQETDQRYHILPANTSGMVNGHYYYYRIKTYNAQGQESLYSNSVPFYCYSTPVITITNLPSGEIPVIETNNFEFLFNYRQAEGELLDYIRFDLSIIYTDEQGNERYEGVYTSGNILANEENEYSAQVYGLISGAQYGLDISGVTVNDTEFSLHDQQGHYQRFTVHSEAPTYYSQISVEPKCLEGYVDVSANLVVTDGEALYAPQYVGDENNKQILLLPRHSWVKWTQGFSIQQTFTIGLWGKIGQEGEILRLYNSRNEGFIKFSYRRGYIQGRTQDFHDQPYDFIEFELHDEDGELVLYTYSQPIPILKPNEDYFMFFQLKDSNNISLKFIKLVTTDFEWRWNIPNEVYYGQMLPNNWENEDWKDYGRKSKNPEELIISEDYDPMKVNAIIPLTSCRLMNGVYDCLDITADTTLTPETYVPAEWTNKTILDANFNGNISGGNTDILLSEVGYLRVKRRQKDATKWITLKEYKVEKPEDFKITYKDMAIPSGVEQIYAIVPVDPNGQETAISKYITKSTGIFNWKGVFMSLGENVMRFFSRVQYQSLVKNRQIGTFAPIASKYPVVVQNAATSYLSGTLSATILGEDFDGTINRQSVVAQLKKIHEWLDSGDAVVLKDWNGWVLICRAVSGDTISFDANYGNGVATATFNFVEQGAYDNQDDLYEAGIIDYKE